MKLQDFEKWGAAEWRKNKTNKEWIRAAVSSAEVLGNSLKKKEHFEALFWLLIDDIKTYLSALDEVDKKRGKGRSPARSAASAANGKKGGRPRKIKEV